MYADALICSHPRSGGRWLRYLLAHSIAAHHRLGLEVTPQTVFSIVPDHHHDSARGYPAFKFNDRRSFPLVAVCHQSYSWELHRGYPAIFLARNAYDVVVSAYAHTQEKSEFKGSMREFLRHSKLGLAAWIRYMNAWAPKVLTHRDTLLLSYAELDADPARALGRVLAFLNQTPGPGVVQAAVESGTALRSGRGIRTGQEGNFWDHLDPESIFDIQEILQRDLSEAASRLLQSMGVEQDPFPRSSDGDD